jgi:predicted DNA-binding transcriptional regulator YafY
MSVRLERLIRIYNRLRRGPVTIEMASQWAQTAGIKVSSRQLYRDLNELQRLQIAEGENVVEFVDEKNRKTWKLEYAETSERLTHFDINSFFLLKNFAPEGIIKQRTSSIEKFEKIFYKALSQNKYQQYTQAHELYFRRTNYFGHIYGEIEHQQLEEYIWALHNKRSVLIDSIGINPANLHLLPDAFPLAIYPMQLVLHYGRLYLSGLTEQHKLVNFAVDKDTKFRLTNKTFNRKKLEAIYEKQMEVLFGISDPLDNKVYHIKIEFTSNYAQSWMRYFWHQSQQWTPMKNGNYMLHLHCSIGREVFGFLAYGLDKVKVHSPKKLKDLFQKKMQQTLAIYTYDLSLSEEEANKDY